MAATITAVTLSSGEGAAVNTVANTEAQLEILFQKQDAKKTTNYNISDEFSLLFSILIFLILIAVPLLYISGVDSFADYDICVKHKNYSFNINKIFLLGSIMSILVIPLSKYKIHSNNITKIVSLVIHGIMITLYEHYQYNFIFYWYI